MKIKPLLFLITVIILTSPHTISAKEKTTPKAKLAETAPPSNLTIDLSKCTQIGTPQIRLKCFDELADREIKDAPKRGEPVVNINGKWNVLVKPDPVDDIKTVTLSLAPEDSQRIRMIIHCKSDETTFYIDWDTGHVITHNFNTHP